MAHKEKGKINILKDCTLPFTAVGQVNLIVTELGVMLVTDKGLLLTEIAPDTTVEQIQEVTEAQLIISDNLITMQL